MALVVSALLLPACVGGRSTPDDPCPDGSTECEGGCVYTEGDPANCGACGTACAAGQSCLAGACVGAGCSAGLTGCGGACVDVGADPANCGACGAACAAGQSCLAGACVGAGCGAGLIDCGGVCVDVSTSPANCGACGTACFKGQSCLAGACVSAGCSPDLTKCGGACVDLRSDPFNCGACGVACDLEAGCDAGACIGVPPPPCSLADLGSTVPQSVTGSTAGRPNTVSTSCAPSDASDAAYTFTAPADGNYTFDTIGSSYDTVLHVHDGGCAGPELACNDDSGGPSSLVTLDLTAGQVVTIVVDGFNTSSGDYVLTILPTPACPPGLAQCGSACVDLQTDAFNCGECGAICDPDSACEAGICFFVEPPPITCPLADLGSYVPQSVTGSTAGRPNDVSTTCGVSHASDAGYTFTAPLTGSYTFDTIGSAYDTVLHVHNGGCAGPQLACNDDSGGGTQSLVRLTLTAGQLVTVVVDGYSTESGRYALNITSPTTCPGGQTQCGGVCVDLLSDPFNCGACGSACAADTTCQGGFCTPAGCPLGLALCGGACVDLVSDPFNCGACGLACPFGATCDAGTCFVVEPPISCPLSDLGSTVPQSVSGSTAGRPNDVSATCGSSTASDAGYTFTASLTGAYTFDTIGSGYDTVLHVHNGGCTGPELGCNDDTVGVQSRVTLTLTAGQVVTIVVDGYSSSSGSYTLNISSTACPSGQTQCGGGCVDLQSDPFNCGACGSACGADAFCQAGVCTPVCPFGLALCGGACVDLLSDPFNCGACGLACAPDAVCQTGACFVVLPGSCTLADLGSAVPQSVSGSTVGRSNDVTPTCVTSNSPEAGYTFTAPVTGTYTFDTIGSAFDTVLDVRDGGCTGPELACNDDTVGVQSQVTLTLAAGQVVTIVVDGYSVREGSYVLNLRLN